MPRRPGAAGEALHAAGDALALLGGRLPDADLNAYPREPQALMLARVRRSAAIREVVLLLARLWPPPARGPHGSAVAPTVLLALTSASALGQRKLLALARPVGGTITVLARPPAAC